MCDVLTNPASFDGKLVRIKGTAIAGFDEFSIRDSSCKQSVNAIWLAYPEGTKAKAGPVAFLQLQLAKNSTGTPATTTRTPVQLEKNKDFQQFDSLLSTPYKGKGMCLGCERYTVTATLVGRLDGVKDVGQSRDGSGKFVSTSGFGNAGLYPARLVLQSVSDVQPHEIDYSKAASVTKDDTGQSSSGGDPVAAGHQAASVFGTTTPAGQQIEEAAGAFGKQGEDNGVEINFGTGNEVPKGDGAKGSGNSPDGLLFHCTFAMDRLKGDPLSKAIVHMGSHIANIRSMEPAPDAFHFEYRAWQTTVLSAFATHQKTLTLPGAFVIWNSAWEPNDRSKLVDSEISSFLTDWGAFRK